MKTKYLKISLTLASALMVFACDNSQTSNSASTEQASSSAVATKSTTVLDLTKSAQAVTDKAAEYIPQIKQAVDKIATFPTDFSQFQKQNLTSEKLTDIVSSIKNVDVSKCPDDFKSAYAELERVAGKISEAAAKLPKDKASVVSAAQGLISGGNATEQLNAAYDEMKKLYAEFGTSKNNLMTIVNKYIK